LLLVGLGFLAMVLGTIGSGIMVSLVWQGLQGSGRSWPLIAVHLVSMRMWVWLVLPALAYGAARVLPLRPWRAAAVTVTTGELFSLAFRVAGTGVEGLYRHWLELLLWVATSAAGLWLTARAVEKARAAFALSQTRATAQAQARAAEYAHFRQEAERLAEAHESKPPGGEP
jgi:hypothetical protein